MVNNYQSLLDMIKPQEEDQMMSSMAPEQLGALQPAPEIIPEMPPQTTPEAVSNQPQESDVQTPPLPLDRRQALLEEFQNLRSGTDDLAEARKRDRMLKIGGALGDALATIIKARGQMSAKVPGAPVQEGAGLAKVADMFQTAPEIASDLAQRRQALMDEYRQMVTGEQDKLAKDLKERQVKAYEDQVKAQVKKLEAAARPEVTQKEVQPSFEEKEKIKAKVKEDIQVSKENRQIKEKLESAIPTVDEQIKNVKNALDLINKSTIAGTGPLDQYFAGASPEGQLLKKSLRNIQLDTLVTKFQGMSRAVDTETDRKFFQETQPDMGNFERTNKKMLNDILERLEGIKQRSEKKLNEIKSQGETKSENTSSTNTTQATNLVRIKGPSGQEATMTEEKAQKYLSKPGYKRIN
jgi:hypothetical protein